MPCRHRGRAESKFHTFLTLALDGSERLTSHPSCFTPGENSPWYSLNRRCRRLSLKHQLHVHLCKYYVCQNGTIVTNFCVVYRYPNHPICSVFEFCAHALLNGKVCLYQCNKSGATEIQNVAQKANAFQSTIIVKGFNFSISGNPRHTWSA